MQPKMCTVAVWTMVLLAVLLLLFQGRMSLLAVVLPLALLLACVISSRGTTRLADSRPEKR